MPLPASRKLTTHLLDTAHGRPAAGVRVTLYRGDTLVRTANTNTDGRTDGPLVEGDAFPGGTYRLEFAIGDYFALHAHPDARRFLDVVHIVFVVDDMARAYHVPLLFTPWSYSTYRGS